MCPGELGLCSELDGCGPGFSLWICCCSGKLCYGQTSFSHTWRSHDLMAMHFVITQVWMLDSYWRVSPPSSPQSFSVVYGTNVSQLRHCTPTALALLRASKSEARMGRILVVFKLEKAYIYTLPGQIICLPEDTEKEPCSQWAFPTPLSWIGWLLWSRWWAKHVSADLASTELARLAWEATDVNSQ